MTPPVEQRVEDHARAGSNGSAGLATLYLLDACGAVLQNAVLARYLQLHDYGVLAALLSAGMFVYVVADFGTGLAVSRLMALPFDGERSRHFRSLWAVRLLLTVLATSVAVGIAWACAPAVGFSVLAIVGSELFRSVATFFASAARGLGRVRPVMTISGCERLGTLSCSVLAVTRGWGLQGVALAYLGARMVSCVCAFVWALNAGLSIRARVPARALWKECWGLAPLATLLLSDKLVFYSMPLLLVAGSSPTETGLFQAAFKIGLLPISACSALLAAFFPEMVKDAAHGRGPQNAVGVYFFMSVVATPLIALCVTLPKAILGGVFGPAFAQGATTLRLIAVFVVLNTAYQVAVHLLPAYGRERVLLRSTSRGAVLCILTALVSVRALGAVGAVIAILVYATTSLLPNLSALRRAVRLNPAQRRSIAEGWWWLATGVILTAPLGFLEVDDRVLIVTWAIVSGIGVFTLLFRQRSMLLPLLWSRSPAGIVPGQVPSLVEDGGRVQ
jgi:O-antigen/teichoic acid export membrane protein